MKIKTLDDAIASEDSEEFPMRNLKITLAYDGTEFSGWQVQPGLETIQGTLASAIGRLTGEKVLPQGSGRTDAGVHALAQVASFATESSIPVENWQKALNDSMRQQLEHVDRLWQVQVLLERIEKRPLRPRGFISTTSSTRIRTRFSIMGCSAA